MLEKEVVKKIRQSLSTWQMTGVVEWFERLQSLKIRHQGYWIQGCAKGTPDFLALVRNKDNGLTAVFIEAKSPTGELRLEQEEFAHKYNKKNNIHVLKISDPKELNSFINEIGIDTTKDIKWPD